jgi:hypothetical protein
VLVALRKLGRREVRELLEKKGTEMPEKKVPVPRGKRAKRISKK